MRHLSALDVVAALGQLAAVTPSEIHRAALNVAISAVQFRDVIESAIERHQHDQAQVLAARGPGTAWDSQEDQHLRVAFESGMSLDAIAERHGRDPLEVASRLHRPLGILTEQAVDEIRQARLRQRREEPILEAALLPTELIVPPPAPAPAAVPVAAPAPAPAPVVVAAPVAAPVASPAPSPAPVAIATPAVAPTVAPTPTVAAPAVVEAPAQAPAPVSEPAPVAPEPVAIETQVPQAPPVPTPVAAPSQPVAAAPAEAVAFEGGKPVLTAAEDKAVQSVLTKYVAKNSPKAALRTYVESEKFTTKVRPEVLVWMRAELDRLG